MNRDIDLNQLITDEQIEIAWGNANFVDISKRDVLFETLQQLAKGYSTGRTACLIVNELGLAVGERLTELGYKYMVANELLSSTPIPQEVDAGELFDKNADCFTDEDDRSEIEPGSLP